MSNSITYSRLVDNRHLTTNLDYDRNAAVQTFNESHTRACVRVAQNVVRCNGVIALPARKQILMDQDQLLPPVHALLFSHGQLLRLDDNAD